MDNITISNLGSTSSNFVWTSQNVVTSTKKEKKGFWIFSWVKKQITEISVEEFFERAKLSKKQVVILDGVVNKYLSQIERAEKLGQVAMVEKMKDEIEIVKKEALACAKGGIKEYLEEKQLKELLNKSSKNIAITPLKNFTRFIPDKVAMKLEKLQKENLFDEYVVVHYDPKKEAVKMTKKEEEKAKDPILFGKINGSNNFYYVGDWIDEYCNLTLKEAVVILGEKPKTLLTN